MGKRKTSHRRCSCAAHLNRRGIMGATQIALIHSIIFKNNVLKNCVPGKIYLCGGNSRNPFCGSFKALASVDLLITRLPALSWQLCCGAIFILASSIQLEVFRGIFLFMCKHSLMFAPRGLPIWPFGEMFSSWTSTVVSNIKEKKAHNAHWNYFKRSKVTIN